MSKLSGINPLSYLGVTATDPPQLILEDRIPTSTDSEGFAVGSLWVVRNANQIWALLAKADKIATWSILFPTTGASIHFETNLGTATVVGDTIKVLGGTNLRTTGVGDEVTINMENDISVAGTLTLSALTAGTLRSDGAGVITSLADGVNGEVLIASGTGVPTWNTLTNGQNINITEAANSITVGIAGIIPIVNGGTNSNAMANTYGVNYFDGTSVTTTAVGTATHVLTSNGAGVAPTFQVASGGGGGITWNKVTGTSQTMEAGNGYVPTNAALTTFTINTSTFGVVVAVAGFSGVGGGGAGWRIEAVAGAGETISLVFQSSTVVSAPGTTAFIESNSKYDCVELVCVQEEVAGVPARVWVVRTSVGNLTLGTV